MNSAAEAQFWSAFLNLNFNLLKSVGLNFISTKSLVDPVYSPLLTKLKSSPSSVIEEYISTSFAKPFPLAESLLAEYTILSILVVSLNVTTTSFVKFASLGFPVSQWVSRLPSMALSIVELLYFPPLLVMDFIFDLLI